MAHRRSNSRTHTLFSTTRVFVVLAHLRTSTSAFTCADGYASCPDDNVQAASSGGRVHVVVRRAINLPDSDSFAQSGVTDPYVKIEAGSRAVVSSVADESIHPTWDEELDLGYHNSGDLVKVSVMDSDSGLELGDDMLHAVTLRVPWCSAFHADIAAASCGDEYAYECDVQGTAWSMPLQPRCNESSWVYLGGDVDGVGGESGCGTDDTYACLQLDFVIVPFQVEVLQTYSGEPFLVTVAGYDASFASDSAYNDYGIVYNDLRQLLGYQSTRSMFDDLRGGLMVRTDADEAGTTGGGEAVDFAINADATVWVCKWYEDTLAFGDPSWLTNGGWQRTNTARAYLDGYLEATEYFACWKKFFAATERNYWGAIESEPITLYANGVDGRESWMYLIIVVPRVEDEDAAATYTRDLDSSALWSRIAEHALSGAFFAWLSYSFLVAKGFRLDLIQEHLVQASVVTGRNRGVASHLLACYGKSEKNAEFRRNLCLAAFATQMALLLPVFVLWSAGVTMIITVNPPAVGFLLCFVGSSFVMGWFGYNHWRARGWMMTWLPLSFELGSALLLLAFLVALVFVEPSVYFGSEDIDFCGLTSVFFTLGMLPLVFILFSNDAKLRRSGTKLGAKVGEVTRLEMKGLGNTRLSPTLKRTLSEEMMTDIGGAAIDRAAAKKTANGEKGELMAKNPFYSLLGDCYTIVSSIRTFRFSDILSATLSMSPSKTKQRNRYLYGTSIAFHLVYLAVSAARTKYFYLSVLNIVTLLVLDSCHFSIHHGSTYWSPGYGILLMAAARVTMMVFMPRLWLVGYSVAFVVYSGALVREVVTHRLPRLNKEEAGAVVFLGHDPKGSKCDDIAAYPELVLGYTCLYFVLVLVALEYGGLAALPTSSVSFWGQEWPAYIFIVAGILVVFSSGLCVASFRSVSLGKQGLLPARLSVAYLWHRSVRLPAVLAIGTALCLFCTGLLVWAATGSSAQFKICLCLPAIVLLGQSSYSRWVKNDFELVPWPPNAGMDKAAGIMVAGDEEVDDTPDAAQLAAGMLGDLFRPSDFGNGADGGSGTANKSHGRAGIILPEFRPTGDAYEGQIQMPVLPLKSALQRTRAAKQRQNAGVDGEARGRRQASADIDGDDAEGSSAAIASSEVRAKVRLKYVRRRPDPNSDEELDGEENLGLFVKMGVALSRLTSGDGPACALCRCVRQKSAPKGKVSPDNEDFGEGELSGDIDYEALREQREGAQDEREEVVEERVDSLSFRRAFLEGYLLPHEYAACYSFVACIALTIVMGLLLSGEEPAWAGHLLWTGMLVALFTFLPAAKWFGTYEVDSTMKLSLWAAGILLTTTCVLMFLLVLEGEAFRDESLAVLNAFLAYPFVAYSIFSVYQAIDGPTPSKIATSPEEQEGDYPNEPSRLSLAYHRTVGRLVSFRALVVAMAGVWLLQSFLWGGLYVGCGLSVAAAIVALAGLIVRDYLARGSIMSRSSMGGVVRLVANAIMLACLVAALLGIGAEAFCTSVFFIVWIIRIAMVVATRLLEIEPDTIIYFAPWVFPALTYDARTQNVADESPVTSQVFGGMLVGLAWGIAVAIFVEPVGVGVVISCVFLMALAATAAWCMSYCPSRLEIASQFLDSSLVFEAGDVARSCFVARHAPFQVECREYTTGVNGTGESPAVMTAARIFEARESAADLAVELEEKNKRLRFVLDEETGSDQLRSDALYSIGDAFMEAFVSGRGPLGPLGLHGLWFGILRLVALVGKIRCCRRLGEDHNPLFARYYPDGQRRDVDKLAQPLEHPDILLEILDSEEVFRKAFQDELMCMMHFQILVLVSAEARLQREGILFRKFLKDNHFKLLSNGIVPPKHIFRSNSFATVNIPMVAVWLSGLTGEERERFQMLRRKFCEMQAERDAEIIAADEASEQAAKELEQGRRAKVKAKSEKRRQALMRRRGERADAWREHLSIQDQQTFAGLRAQWLKHDNVTVHSHHQSLRESFVNEVLLGGEETEANAREILDEIASEGQNCRPGAYGRKLQFADPEFPPDNSSVGNAQCRQQLAMQWKVSLAVNPDIRLFDEGTDPDDVRQGAFADAWLLSALSMISAATIGDGGIDEQIAQLFVSPIGRDGHPVHESYTGAYAVKIMVNGEWQVVIVDDFFPAIEASRADEDNKGLAAGHSYGTRELWVSLLEKAYAKFYGNYAALETGHVHHALTAFTGAQAEEIFLAGAGRGVGKRSLWRKIMRYQRNGYIMGAGVITGNLVERQIQDIGLVFGAAYTILEVVDSDGENLVKLRNPPGDHEEWRGDWGDHSSLWTRRRRRRLGLVQNERDNSFWMSFNDFCIVFRSLYVCRWYDPRHWTTLEQTGNWEMREDVDTAAGLPSARQQVCELENNPQFTLDVDHQTDVKISLIQTDDELQPAACFVLRESSGKHSPSRARPGRISQLSREVVVASSGPPSKERERNIYVTLGSGVYVVMCAAFLAGMEGSFKVVITTNSRHLKFRKLWPPADAHELEKAFDDRKAAGHIANLGLEKLGAIGAGLGDQLNARADKAVNDARASKMEQKIAAARRNNDAEKKDQELADADAAGTSAGRENHSAG